MYFGFSLYVYHKKLLNLKKVDLIMLKNAVKK